MQILMPFRWLPALAVNALLLIWFTRAMVASVVTVISATKMMVRRAATLLHLFRSKRSVWDLTARFQVLCQASLKSFAMMDAFASLLSSQMMFTSKARSTPSKQSPISADSKK